VAKYKQLQPTAAIVIPYSLCTRAEYAGSRIAGLPLTSIVLGDDAVLLGQPGEAVVRLSHPPDVAADGVGLAVARVPAGGGVHVSDVHLDRGVVLSRDQTVARRALPWDIHVHEFSSIVLHGSGFVVTIS